MLRVHGNQALWNGRSFGVVHGRSGYIDVSEKCEGDGCTPIGVFTSQTVYYRADRIEPPQTVLPLIAITSSMGWCYDPRSPDYNQPIQKPYPWNHEDLYREDSVYDLLITVDHNTHPVIPGKGSAIFIHLFSENKGPTAGCIAMDFQDLLRVVVEAEVGTKISLAAS